MTELKPCPFCGSTSVEIRFDERDCSYIQCLICDALVSTGVFESSYEDIVKLWNSRSVQQTGSSEVYKETPKN